MFGDMMARMIFQARPQPESTDGCKISPYFSCSNPNYDFDGNGR